MNSLYSQVVAVLKKNGYNLYRQGKGSHEYWCINGQHCVTVPSNVQSRHTANSIFKQAGIKHKI
jgi:predicted RNA binding protein YcfA (HicA-like mRNA interferase family)